MLSMLARHSALSALAPATRLLVGRTFAPSSIRLLASTTTATKERAAKATVKTKAKSTSTSTPKPRSSSKSATKTKTESEPKPKASRKKASKPKLLYKDIKEHLPPRRPKGAYMLFAEEMRAKRTQAITSTDEAIEQFIATGKAWSALPESEKETYRTRSAPAVDAYKVQYAEWAGTVDPAALRVINCRRTKLGKYKYRRHSETPRAANPYARFLKQMVEEHPPSEAPPGEKYIYWIARQTSARWKGMGDAEKAKYKEAFEAAREKRQAEIDSRA